jgi:hypothetical protein
MLRGAAAGYAVVSTFLLAGSAAAQEEPSAAPPASAPTSLAPVTVACSSSPGERRHCAADTSNGVVLARSRGEAPCLLGKSWGYDDKGVWVSDGCSGEFVVGRPVSEEAEKAEAAKKPIEHIPNLGFRLYEGEKGQIYMRLFSYVRYLNQKGLDASYTDSSATPRRCRSARTSS